MVPTGYNSIDQLIGGVKPGQLVILGARPSAGKTALALNMAIEMEQKNCNVAFLSLEMSTEEVIERMAASMAQVKLKLFSEANSFSEDEQLKVTDVFSRIQNMNIVIDDKASITPAYVRRYARKMQKDSKKNVIIIDYLTLMNSDTNYGENRRLAVEDISRQLKIIAKENQCAIIALSQLSRGVESRTDKRPMMSDLREAGGIEQDADMIFLLYRDDYYNKPTEYDPQGKSVVECIVVKNRNGEVGTAKLDFYKPIQRFYG